MPNIRISDEAYERLKGYADKEMRSITNATEHILMKTLLDYETKGHTSVRTDDLFSSRPASAQSEEPVAQQEPIAVAPPEHKSREIIAKINELNKKIRDADTINQDPDYWDVINGYKQEVDRLWQEFNKVNNV